MSVVTPDRGLRGPQEPILYPESDGKPMADNEAQLFLMLLMIAHLRHKFEAAGHHSGGNMFWYPVEGDPRTVQAPDVFVAFDRPQLPLRRSWKQWEEDDRALAFAVEIVSDSNTRREIERKRAWYERFGVQELVVLDPERGRIVVHRRVADSLQVVVGERRAISVGLEFRVIPDDIEVIDSDLGRVLDYGELQARLGAEQAKAMAEAIRADREQLRADREAGRAAEFARQAADASRQAADAGRRADDAGRRADEAGKRADEAGRQVDEARRRADRLAEQLRALGIEPD